MLLVDWLLGFSLLVFFNFQGHIGLFILDYEFDICPIDLIQLSLWFVLSIPVKFERIIYRSSDKNEMASKVVFELNQSVNVYHWSEV